MTKKLKIIGPYTPEHPGPYTLNLPMLKGEEYEPVTVHCVVDGIAFITTADVDHPWTVGTDTLMNAEEVPVAREFWVNEYAGGTSGKLHLTEASAKYWSLDSSFIRTIHVREVLPGDAE